MNIARYTRLTILSLLHRLFPYLKARQRSYKTTGFKEGKQCTVICGHCGQHLSRNERMDVQPFDDKTVTKLMPIYYDAKFNGETSHSLVMLPQIHTSNVVTQLSRPSGEWMPLICNKCDKYYQNVLVLKNLDINILVCL